jgi:IclR family KDG regulon transcriptional repressor
LEAEDGSAMKKYNTLHDLASIFQLFNNYKVEERSIAEISKTLGITRNKVSRMMSTLEDKGFFDKNLETGKYRLGMGFLELGIVYAFNLPLRKIIRPHIEQISKELKFSVSWAILKDSKIVVIDRVQNLGVDLMTYNMGLTVPVHSTSIGKILLAFLSEEEQDKILQASEITKFTEATVVDRELIKGELRAIRQMGYATDKGETYKGINCIAVPIKNGIGDVIAAVNLMEQDSGNRPEKVSQFIDYLKEKALFISRQLGYRSNM